MLSEDFELQGERVDRVTVAKDTLKAFIENRPNDRIGLAVFSSHAYIAAPPTLDHDFLRRHIDRMEVLGEQGTAIGAGLSAAVNRLRDLKSKSRIVILLTDGQNNAGNVPPLTAAEAAQGHCADAGGPRCVRSQGVPTGSGRHRRRHADADCGANRR
jgi:Ca-activated chloride channel family protein